MTSNMKIIGAEVLTKITYSSRFLVQICSGMPQIDLE